MPSPEEMFHHLYHDALRDLNLIRAENELNLKALEASKNQPKAQTIILKQYRVMIDDVLKKFSIELVEPESVLRNGLSALNRIEEFRFILENLIETVKRDESLHNALGAYSRLGLVDLGETITDETRSSPWPSNFGSGLFLRKLWNGLRKAALTVMEMVSNAIKLVPQLVSLKPAASIGVSGPFPTFSLQFNIEAEAITVHEFFRALMP